MKLLIGYDGSECGKAAIEDLVLAGLPSDVDARVLSVADLLVQVPYEDYQLPVVPDDRPTARIVRTARARGRRDARSPGGFGGRRDHARGLVPGVARPGGGGRRLPLLGVGHPVARVGRGT